MESLDELKRVHKEYITSSQIAKIVNISRFGTAWDVWNEKKGISQEEKSSNYTIAGTILEPAIASLYQLQYNVELFKADRIFHRNFKFSAAPDYFFVEDNQVVLIEIKNTNAWSDPANDILPKEYIIQVIWQMGVFQEASPESIGNYPVNQLSNEARLVFLIGGNTLKVFPITFSSRIWHTLKEEALLFLQNLEDNVPPAVDPSESCSRALAAAPMLSRNVIEDESCLSQLERLHELKTKATEINKEIKLIENALKEKIGGNYGVSAGDFKFIHYARKLTTLNKKAFIDELLVKFPETKSLVEKHTRTTTSRIGRLIKKKGSRNDT